MPDTVVGLIDGENHVQDAINDLLNAGFGRNDIGLIAPEVRSESERMLSTTRTGLALGATAAILLGAAALSVPGVGAAMVAGPLLAVPALAALVGGLAGALSVSGVPEKDANFYAEGVRRGGALITVTVRNPEQAATAARILEENGAARIEQETGKHEQASAKGSNP